MTFSEDKVNLCLPMFARIFLAFPLCIELYIRPLKSLCPKDPYRIFQVVVNFLIAVGYKVE